jgi:hypothetical protein
MLNVSTFGYTAHIYTILSHTNMLISAVSVLIIALPSSEFPERNLWTTLYLNATSLRTRVAFIL